MQGLREDELVKLPVKTLSKRNSTATSKGSIVSKKFQTVDDNIRGDDGNMVVVRQNNSHQLISVRRSSVTEWED